MCNRDSLQPTQAKEDILTNNIQTCKISYICSHVSIGNTDTTHVVMLLCVCSQWQCCYWCKGTFYDADMDLRINMQTNFDEMTLANCESCLKLIRQWVDSSSREAYYAWGGGVIHGN